MDQKASISGEYGNQIVCITSILPPKFDSMKKQVTCSGCLVLVSICSGRGGCIVLLSVTVNYGKFLVEVSEWIHHSAYLILFLREGVGSFVHLLERVLDCKIWQKMSTDHRMIDQLSDFVTGWIAGCAGVLVSHPFDTIRIRLQSQGVVPDSSLRYNGTIHCFIDTVKKEKVVGLFKGITPPLIGTAIWNSVVFGVYGNVMRILSKEDSGHSYSFTKTTIASMFVALAQSVIICPIELIKSRLQVQCDSTNALYKGPVDCIRKIHRAHGIRGLFRGFGPTIIRDIPGFFTYFNSFELICLLLSDRDGSLLGPFALMFAGGMAGTISWTTVFPPDVIKTRIQIDVKGRYNGFLQCLKSSFHQDRWQLFVRGLAPTIVRAFPMNAAIFTVDTLLKRIYLGYTIESELHS